MSKYYTPEIEEFHVGFEYEMLEMGSKTKYNPATLDKWDDLTGDYDSSTLLYEIARGRQLVRVKYLDREDIESLGFKHVNGLVYDLPETNISLWYNFSLVTPSNSVTIRKKEGSMLFDVAVVPVKNKSELKRLLKQLNIV